MTINYLRNEILLYSKIIPRSAGRWSSWHRKNRHGR